MEVYLPFITKAINHIITKDIFAVQLKKSQFIPLYQNRGGSFKEGELQTREFITTSKIIISKVLERIIYKQINIYKQKKLSKHKPGFGKSHRAKHSLITMLEKWNSSLDKGENNCVLFIDLSKSFDTINHNLLLAKLKAYGFPTSTLDLICSYLKTEDNHFK